MKPWRMIGWAILAAGCTTAGPGTPPATGLSPGEGYPRSVSTPYVTVSWACTARPNAVRVEGVVQNTKGGRVRFGEVELAAADGRWGHAAAVKTALPDVVLHPNQSSPFALELRKVRDERFDLFYAYTIDPPPGEDTRQRYMARDACRTR
ncbi:MAG: hypothetical protein ACE147_12755 [Candidatus Methylomirabilales bacterium]